MFKNKWTLQRIVDYYPFDIYLVNLGYTKAMKKDFGWAFKNTLYYYNDNHEYSYRDEKDLVELKSFLIDELDDNLIKFFTKEIRKRINNFYNVTQETFKNKNNFNKELNIFYQSFVDLFAIFQLPALAQNLLPDTKQSRLIEFGLEREKAVKKLLKAEKIYRQKLGKYLNLERNIALSLLPDEILTILKDDEYPLNFRKRKKYLMITRNENQQIYWNREAENIFKQEIKNKNKIKIINGNGVYPGLVKGEVYIALKPSDFHNIPSGVILVCSITRYDIVKYLKKVKAIITDQGGITCHTAIISRELNIPCIVGTKIATQNLKNGDMVEVNANKGTIKILNK